ncbi:hypothetical protein JOQ06_010926, partial [Pogonophryne albipinna]
MAEQEAFDVLGFTAEEKMKEQCVFPKATEATFKAALYENHLDKSNNFLQLKGGKKAQEAHFELWATTSLTGWRRTKTGLIQKSSMHLLSLLFKEEAAAPGIKKQKKGSSFQTVSNFYR